MASNGGRGSGGNRSRRNGKLQPGEAAKTALALITQLTGRRP